MSISIRLTSDEEARLGALAARTGRSKSFYVRASLHEYLDDLEDAFAADAALKEFSTGRGHTRPLADLIDTLGFTEDELASARAANDNAP